MTIRAILCNAEDSSLTKPEGKRASYRQNEVLRGALIWALIYQLLVIILGVTLYRSVHVELGPAQIRQGMEIGHEELLNKLREAEVNIPEELDKQLPNKEVIVAPGLIEFNQRMMMAIPAFILQLIALALTIGSILRIPSINQKGPEPQKLCNKQPRRKRRGIED